MSNNPYIKTRKAIKKYLRSGEKNKENAVQWLNIMIEAVGVELREEKLVVRERVREGKEVSVIIEDGKVKE